MCSLAAIFTVCLMGLDARVVVRRDGAELCLDSFVNVKTVDKMADALLCDGLVGTRQCFQGFVGMWVGLATEYGLDGLGYDSPTVVEICINTFLVEKQFA